MIFVNKKKHNVDNSHIEVTESYLNLLAESRENVSCLYEDNLSAVEAIKLLDTSIDACMELYRFCLCFAFGLECKLAYEILQPLSKSVTNILKEELRKRGLLTKSKEYKQGFVEACMHCIVMSRNVARGDK